MVVVVPWMTRSRSRGRDAGLRRSPPARRRPGWPPWSRILASRTRLALGARLVEQQVRERAADVDASNPPHDRPGPQAAIPLISIRTIAALSRCTRAVIPALVAGIHRTARSGARGWLDTGDKPRYDNRARYVAAAFPRGMAASSAAKACASVLPLVLTRALALA